MPCPTRRSTTRSPCAQTCRELRVLQDVSRYADCKLVGGNRTRSDLVCCYRSRCKLRGTDCTGSDLTGCDGIGCKFVGGYRTGRDMVSVNSAIDNQLSVIFPKHMNIRHIHGTTSQRRLPTRIDVTNGNGICRNRNLPNSSLPTVQICRSRNRLH
ncbi:pentapeptide repeat-containing protein [Ochrobactrum sp. MYb379]|uniref:pentapeptide repeat-containing protein n=1 Tax=Ochrobactrum sp. MYb379 TaxID=2745275 RepID=UPI00403F16F5